MGLTDKIKGQFVDVIECPDTHNKLVVYKYNRPDNEIKQGAQVIVRESQVALFLKGGRLADVLPAGTYTLNTGNLPVLSTLGAIGHGFRSPIRSDLYFIHTHQFAGNKWGTPNPVIMRDTEFGLVRVRAFGSYSFRVVDAPRFMTQLCGVQNVYFTKEILEYLTSMVCEALAGVLAKCGVSVVDLALKYRDLASEMARELAQKAEPLGLQFVNVNIENISLPEEVEKMIDERSNMGLMGDNMGSFIQYQSARAIRDAAQQSGGLAGVGVGMGLGNQMAGVVQQSIEVVKVKCPACGELNDEDAKFCDECGAKMSAEHKCPQCGNEVDAGSKFCNECGTKLMN